MIKRMKQTTTIEPHMEKFKILFCDVQSALRKIRELTMDDGLNHSEILNMVLERV